MSKSTDPLQQIYRIIIGLIIIGFVYVIWPYIATVVVMLVFAFLFTTILLPGVDNLERKIKSRGLSVLIMTIIVIAVISVFLGGFTSGLVKQAKEFSSQLNQDDYISDLNSFAEKAVNSLPEFVRDIIPRTGNMADKLQGQVSGILQNLLSFAGAVGSFLFTVVMVIIFTVIILYGYYHFRKSLVRFIPNKYFEIGLRLIFNIERSVSSYLRGQLLAATSVAILSIIGLFILNAFGANLTLVVFIGIIAGLANLIPLVGPFVGMAPAILIAFMNNLGNDIALGHKLFGVVPSPFFIPDIILMFLIVQQIDNNYITPKVVGQSVGLHPILVMIALLIGGTLLGPLGMLFAVPTAGVIKVVGQEIAFVSRNAHLL
ncbi:MAG: AI-2E family transporter [Candidatus Marinimicrobia bacterium]|nr:AI-2E family transporter [Candidatus Neomarinimicrobiota bacterium]